MLKKVLAIRYALIIVVFFLLVNALAFIGAGVAHCIHGYSAFFSSGFLPNKELRPGLHLLEALDSFMVALVFMIFGLGIAKIFVFPDEMEGKVPKWLNLHTIHELKGLVWEAILLTMVIFGLVDIIEASEKTLQMLILPGIILILSLSLFLIHKKEKH